MKKCVAGIIEKNGTILVGKKISKEGHYLSAQWHIPGGHIISGETEEEAIKREVKEETNLEVKIIKSIDWAILENGEKLEWFLCKSISSNEKPGDDLAELRWIKRQEVTGFCSDVAVSRWPAKVKEYFDSS